LQCLIFHNYVRDHIHLKALLTFCGSEVINSYVDGNNLESISRLYLNSVVDFRAPKFPITGLGPRYLQAEPRSVKSQAAFWDR
jgi:hypothetical protein